MQTLRILSKLLAINFLAAGIAQCQTVVITSGPLPGVASADRYTGELTYSDPNVGVTARSFAIAIPPSYARNGKSPMLLYCAGTGEESLASSKFREELLELTGSVGMLAVFTEGAPDLTGSPRWNTADDPASPDDTEFLAVLLREINRFLRTDERNTFIAGFSGGSSTVARLAALYPNRFAAAAIVGGSVGSEALGAPPYRAPQPKGRIPVFIWNGTLEPHRPFFGTENHNGTYIPPAWDYVLHWVMGMRLSPIGERLEEVNVTINGAPGITYVKKYNSRARRGVLVHAVTDGQSHVWPSDGVNQGWDGDDRIFRFFMDHAR